MSYRYNWLDVIVGVGMSAIMFGALLLFVATAGTFQAVVSTPAVIDQMSGDPTGMAWLQPPLGQAIVDGMLLERRTNRNYAEAVSEWNRATMALHALSSPFGAIANTAVSVPVEHMARVQGVMGRSIVNFTRRGVSSGVLAAGQLGVEYNMGMIRRAAATGAHLEQAFASTWQATLGRGIVDAAQRYLHRAGAIQQQLGLAILHVTQVQALATESQAANEQQLASLVVASSRASALSDRLQLMAAIEFPQDAPPVRPTTAASWPDVPIGFLIAAVVGLGTIFFAGLVLSGRAREIRLEADRHRDMSRWVYRLAA
jgi:hypothetical protein